jgi:hypothetical protein
MEYVLRNLDNSAGERRDGHAVFNFFFWRNCGEGGETSAGHSKMIPTILAQVIRFSLVLFEAGK